MKPILYASTETAFDTNGIGVLTDAISCTVTEERNGMFELELRYPVSGIHFAEIALRALIMAKPNPVDDAQPFRVYRITKPLNGVVTVYAQHISYDLSGIPAAPFTAASAPAAMAALKSNAVVACPFAFWTDKATSANMSVTAPASIRSLLGGVRGSVLDVYGGEYAFDRYTVRLYAARGANRGVTIRYGKNLTSLEQDANCANVYTGVYPFWTDSEGNNLVQLPGKIVPAPGTYGFVRILPLDLSGEWQDKPTAAQLKARTERYITENNIGVPKVSLEVSFVPLEQSEEYAHLALLERVSLCDTVTVQFAKLGVDATAKVVRTVYDVLLERYDSIELGDARTSIADTIVAQQQAIAAQGQAIAGLPTTSAMQAAIGSATAQITGNLGGYVVLHSSTGGQKPDEILIMDTPDIATATKVWRWNKAGLGYSKNGYNGPYGLAMTAYGQIVADFITTGTLNAGSVDVINLNASNIKTGTLSANLIKAGILQSKDGKSFVLNLDTGSLNMIGSIVAKSTAGDSMELDNGRIQLKDSKGVVRAELYRDDEYYGGVVRFIGSSYYAYMTADGVGIRKMKTPGQIGGTDEIVFDAGYLGDITASGNVQAGSVTTTDMVQVGGNVQVDGSVTANGKISAESTELGTYGTDLAACAWDTFTIDGITRTFLVRV